MKLFGREIRLREKFKGFFASGTSTKKHRKLWRGELSWNDRCKYYDTIYEEFPLAKMSMLTIAGQLMANGVFTECAVNREGEEYQRAKKAQELIDKLNEDIGLDSLLYETAVNMAKHGSCFWEKTATPTFDVRIIPMQETIEPAEVNDIGEITRWKQAVYNKEIASWGADEIVHFAWNVTTRSWPYGTSLYVGLDKEFEILTQLEKDIKEFMHNSAFPVELWQVGDGQFMPTANEVDSIKSSVRNWEPGEKHVTSYPIKREAGGTGDKTISNLNDVLEFLYNSIIDGIGIPPISKQWSSTMASAQEMMPWARANLIEPMQRIFRRKIEREVYRPYLEGAAFSLKVCPKLKWEAPDAHKDEEAEYWALQVQSGIVTADYAAEEQGFDMERIKKSRDEQAEREVEQAQIQKIIEPKQGTNQKQRLEEEAQKIITEISEIADGTINVEDFRQVKRDISKILARLSWKTGEERKVRDKEKQILDYLAKKLKVEANN